MSSPLINPTLLLPLVAGGLTSFFVCVLIAVTKNWHGRLTLDSHAGVQKFHSAPTPRVGGLGIYGGLLVALLVADGHWADHLDELLWASVPAFLAGLTEDITKRISVRERLLATMLSAAIACDLTGVTVRHLGVPGLDSLLLFLPFSIVFTAFAVAGVANSVNIIDGFNGLASGSVMIALGAIGAIAYSAGDLPLARFCLVLGVVTLGFFVVNFPFGKVFLGDGGAYLLGFMLAWVAVLLPARNPGVSAWASLVACAYPVIEVVFSILRRRGRRKKHHPGAPDRLHLHSLIKSRFIRKLCSNWPPVLRNSAVSPFCWLFSALAGVLAYLLADNTSALMLAFICLFLLYKWEYRCMVHFRGWAALLLKRFA